MSGLGRRYLRRRGRGYDNIDLRGGTRLNVDYPAGATGLCGQTPMDRSIDIGEANAKEGPTL